MKLTLEAARVNAGLSVMDVSKALNIHKSTLRNWERGKSIPRVDHLIMMCSLYSTSIDAIFLRSKSSLR